MADNPKEFDSVLTEATERLENDPEHFDPSLTARLREYIDTKTIEGYLAGKALLSNIAYTVFKSVKNYTSDLTTETRKTSLKALSGALVAEAGAVLLKLANLLPNELNWMVNWLDYLAKLLSKG